MLKWHDGREPYKKTYRWIMAILVLVLAYAVLHSIIPKVSANNEQVYIEHTVEPGETIYSISRMYRDDQDWRKTAYESNRLRVYGAYPARTGAASAVHK